MAKETRNQRRSRRRRETKDERETYAKMKRKEKVIETKSKATCTFVFVYWNFESMVGYVYNHPRFASGSSVTTARVVRNQYEFADEGLWVVETLNTVFNVVRMSDAWENVGAGNPRRRLVYKLWPKMIFIGMLRRIMFNPGNSGMLQAMENFEKLSLSCGS